MPATTYIRFLTLRNLPKCWPRHDCATERGRTLGSGRQRPWPSAATAKPTAPGPHDSPEGAATRPSDAAQPRATRPRPQTPHYRSCGAPIPYPFIDPIINPFTK